MEYLTRLGVALEPGWRVEINLRAVDWVREAARRLRRGFLVLIDYGHPARELYSASHSAGTLTSFAGHLEGPVRGTGAPWLERPGEQDITAHVDFTSVQAAAEAEGLTTLAFLDQTYFLLGLVSTCGWDPRGSATRAPWESSGVVMSLKASLALKTLLMPGGLGSTHKVIVFGKDVGRPTLSGAAYGMRVT
jgi:SAM-dependent MidA family methyltransferase